MSKLLFDIGCNIGLWTDANYKQGVKIVGVEPHPELYQGLLGKFQDNKDIIIVNRAVSDVSDEMIDFYLASTHWASTASLEFKQSAIHLMTYIDIKARTITIDDLIKEYGEPDYIKIDVERYEPIALRGLTHKTGMIAFEWDNEHLENACECVTRLSSLGYKDFSVYETDTYTYIPTEWYSSDCVLEQLNNEFHIQHGYKWGMIYAK